MDQLKGSWIIRLGTNGCLLSRLNLNLNLLCRRHSVPPLCPPQTIEEEDLYKGRKDGIVLGVDADADADAGSLAINVSQAAIGPPFGTHCVF